MSHIGDQRHKWVWDNAREKWREFRTLCEEEAYRIGRDGVLVPDLFDHCTGYAMAKLFNNPLVLPLVPASVSEMAAGALEYEEAIAARDAMEGL